MQNSVGFLKIAAIVAAATVGSGVFALPYVFQNAGWLLSVGYLVVLVAIIAAVHTTYLKTLEKVGEKERLLGLSKAHLGRWGFPLGFFAIVVGLLLTLVAYLVLGTELVQLAFPEMPSAFAFLAFWIVISLPMLLDDHRVVNVELFGIMCTITVIVFIFVSAWPKIVFAGVPLANIPNFFLPFGAILFSLAGWTSVEPAYESKQRFGIRSAWGALFLGTGLAATLYILFVAGVLGSTLHVTSDTISGLVDWPLWKRDLLAGFGLLALWTVYMPVSREVKNSLEKDLHLNKFFSRAAVVFLPPALVAAGFNNFLIIVGFVGGVFVGLQYLLIIFVGRRVLAPPPAKKFFLDMVALIFVLAAAYEIYYFVA